MEAFVCASALNPARVRVEAGLKAGNGFLILAAVACCDRSVGGGIAFLWALAMILTPLFGSIPARVG
jgi:hypothetical protein